MNLKLWGCSCNIEIFIKHSTIAVNVHSKLKVCINVARICHWLKDSDFAWSMGLQYFLIVMPPPLLGRGGRHIYLPLSSALNQSFVSCSTKKVKGLWQWNFLCMNTYLHLLISVFWHHLTQGQGHTLGSKVLLCVYIHVRGDIRLFYGHTSNFHLFTSG